MLRCVCGGGGVKSLGIGQKRKGRQSQYKIRLMGVPNVLFRSLC